MDKHMKDFIDYCMKGELDKVILLLSDADILNKALEYYKHPHLRKTTNMMISGIARCISYKHYDMAIYLMSNYCARNNPIDMYAINESFYYWFNNCEDLKYINTVLDLYKKGIGNKIEITDDMFTMACENHRNEFIYYITKKENINIYMKNEACIETAIYYCAVDLFKYLIHLSTKKPYKKAFTEIKLKDWLDYVSLEKYLLSIGWKLHNNTTPILL